MATSVMSQVTRRINFDKTIYLINSTKVQCLLNNFCHLRHYHVSWRTHLSSRTTQVLLGKAIKKRILGVRCSSTSVSSAASQLTEVPIPEPPTPQITNAIVEAIGSEPSFARIGLGGWSPVGIVQNCFEFLHVGCGIPWWTSIIIGTAIVRVLLFPIVIVSQRNAAKMNNYLPQLQVLQLKMTEARQCGNQLDATRYAQELSIFMKEKQLNPLKNMLVPFAQAPVFLSFFMGLRGMTSAPVESMMTGGMLWFTDLTIPDQYYLMPLITSATMFITIELGTDTGRVNSNLGMMKYVLRALPVIILPFTINFPGAVLVYWVSSNFISLLQVAFLRIPRVREFFSIEKLIRHDSQTLPVKSKGFVKGLKESWSNIQITNELQDRQRFDEMQFQRAGRSPIQKTYKFDPTCVQETTNKQVVEAKKRE